MKKSMARNIPYVNGNSGLKIIKTWFNNNLLPLNTSKTIAIAFSLTSANLKPNYSNLLIRMHYNDCTKQKCNCPTVKNPIILNIWV